MALTKLDIPNFDPQTSILAPTRPCQGPVIARAGTLDEEFPQFGRWLLVNVTGPVTVIGWDDVEVTHVGLQENVWHPVFAKAVLTAGTDATAFNWGN